MDYSYMAKVEKGQLAMEAAECQQPVVAVAAELLGQLVDMGEEQLAESRKD
jgi:hypothetical protein